MSAKKTGKKGIATEELVRSYFIGAGFFVLRGVLVKNAGDDLTDIDLWLYERSATLARRRIIIDIKDNATPKAAERLFFVKGLAEVVKAEAVGIVTSDTRRSLRELAKSQNVIWIDNADLQRLKASDKVTSVGRLTDEQLRERISKVDRSRSSTLIRDNLDVVKSAVATKFGPSAANLALEGVQYFGNMALHSHPNSEAAQLAARLTLFCASVAAASLDFASGETALRPNSERIERLASALRFGDDQQGTDEKLNWTISAIRDFAPDGAGVADIVQRRFKAALASIPAEPLAEVISKMSASSALFEAARALEGAAYDLREIGFDGLSSIEKGLLGAMLDFSGIDRLRFAESSRASSIRDTPKAGSGPRNDGQLL